MAWLIRFILAALGLVQKAPDNHVSLEQFKTKVATGEEWISVYRMEIGAPVERLRRKIKAKWQYFPETDSFHRNTAAWRADPDPTRQNCVTVDVDALANTSNPWGKGGVVLEQVNSTMTRQIRFVSSELDTYFWWVICFNRMEISDGICPDIIAVLMVPAALLTNERDIDLTSIPWGKVKDDFHDVLTPFTFPKERMRYNWVDRDCGFDKQEINRTFGNVN